MPVAVVKIWELVNYRSHYVHSPQVVTDYFRDMLTERPISPNSTDPGHVAHTMQHNQGLQRSDYRIKYITTSHPRLVAKRVDQNQTPYLTVPDLGPYCPPTHLSKQNRPMSCHGHFAAQSGTALLRIFNQTYC